MNAIKYTPKYGKINIIARHKAVIEFIDTGIGIPPEEIPCLLKEFFRASNARELEKTGVSRGQTGYLKT